MEPVQPSPAQSNLVQPSPTSPPPPKRPFAWQPLTPKGVAVFANARFGRVLIVQFVFALLTAAVVVWFLARDWFPVVTAAIKRLPSDGEIRSGWLNWRGDSPVSLAENRFLALTVDLKHQGQARSPSHLAIELGERDFKVYSLLGFVQGPYPAGWRIGLNQTEVGPWWGAWAPPILGIVAFLAILNLLLCWTVLATLYAGPACLLGFFANRDVSFAAGWRLSGASLMPGCVLMTAAILIYGLGFLDLIRLGVAVAAHFILGWVYICLSIRRLPFHPEAQIVKSNPFAPSATASSNQKKS